MPKYKVGDKLWAASFDTRKQETCPCPVCFGKLKVTLILGNDDQIELPCDYCGKGNLGVPTGVDVQYREADVNPKQITITGIEIKQTSTKETVEYHSGTDGCYRIYKEDMLFETREAALGKSEEMKEKWLEEQRTRIEHVKANVNKSFVWNAAYHMKQAKEAERLIKYHSEKAKLCKERARK